MCDDVFFMVAIYFFYLEFYLLIFCIFILILFPFNTLARLCFIFHILFHVYNLGDCELYHET